MASGKIIPGVNDLLSGFPLVAAEAHGWDPASVTRFSNKKLSWQCPSAHIWDAAVASRTRLNSGCPYCAGQRPIVGENDLGTTHPGLASSSHNWDPSTVTHGSGLKKEWLCPIGHIFTSAIKDRVGGNGCPICSGKNVLIGFNDLAFTEPDLAREADGWDPQSLTRGSNKILPWLGRCGHHWTASVSNRARGRGCPTCSGKKVEVGFNDFATAAPRAAAEALGWDPTTVTTNSNRILPWRCSEGHIWDAPPARRLGGSGCPYCAGQFFIAGESDLQTQFPEIAHEANGWDPSGVPAGSHLKRLWKCSIGHEWEATVSGRTSKRAAGCPYCSGRMLIPGVNDLLTLFPEIAAEAVGWDPSQVTAHHGSARQWECPKGHSWTTRVANRTSRKANGCPACATTGFSPGKDGWLYFLRHDLWGLLQIGISNVPVDRLARHQRSGWEVLEVIGPMTGDLTYAWEQDILHTLTGLGVELAPKHIAGKFSGYTESWVQEDFPATSLAGLMELVRSLEAMEDSSNS